MAKTENELNFLKYFRTILPSEFEIDKEEIFYRNKYNEIINYIKGILMEKDGLEFYEHISPKGSLLINVPVGTDITDFLKLISKNYYLPYIELNQSEVLLNPESFYESLNTILEDLGREEAAQEKKVEKESDDSKDEKKKRLLIIDQRLKISAILGNRTLLGNFIDNFGDNLKNLNFLDRNIILIWLNYDYGEIVHNSEQLYNTFDMIIKVPKINNIERETILRNFCERNPKISFDIGVLVNNFTKGWEVNDLKQLVKLGIFRHYLNADLNQVSNEITEILIDLITYGEFIPSIANNGLKKTNEVEMNDANQEVDERSIIDRDDVEKLALNVEDLISDIRKERVSDFMLSQLYENAASKNYNELVIIIDKLNKSEVLGENDRKILSQFPFILNEVPNKAQIFLEKAKKKIDLIKQSFGR